MILQLNFRLMRTGIFHINVVYEGDITMIRIIRKI